MRRLLILFFVLSTALALPVLEITSNSTMDARREKASKLSVTVKNKGDALAKNVTLSVMAPWDDSRNYVLPSTPDNIKAGENRTFYIEVKPPFEGTYKITLVAESIQDVHTEKNVTVKVLLSDKPLPEETVLEVEIQEPEPEAVANETAEQKENNWTAEANFTQTEISPSKTGTMFLQYFVLVFLLGLVYVIKLEASGREPFERTSEIVNALKEKLFR